MSKILSVPHLPQLANGYCLPACVQMVLAYWRIERKQAKIAKELGLIPGAGVSGNRVKTLASKKLEIFYGAGTLIDLDSALVQSIPPIVLVNTGELPYWQQTTAHVVVLLGIDQQTVYLNDPGLPQGNTAVSLGDFELAWDEMVNLYALIHKK